MDLVERLIFLGIGGGIGFILGYIVARLRDIKEEVDEVLEIEKRKSGEPPSGNKNERGALRLIMWREFALLLVVALTAFAAFSSQQANNQVQDAQSRIETATFCNRDFLGQLLVAATERTTFTADQARANIELQRSQSQFLAILLADPPKSEAAQAEALRLYFDSLTDFIEVNGNTARKAEENPYPTIEQFNNCLEQDRRE